ncbi:daptide biosynthesis RiPP recognition protein [Streptomyces sp. NPDC057424]|uniref:daptide biosynthesis RiPP recognition protein n=1 Tax=Streptomyces sp. NPDC057424 TaxID=3346127 RepID=UPI0036ADE478
MNTHKRHLMSWVTGRSFGLDLPESGAATIVVESAEDVPRLAESGLLGSRTVVYSPEEGSAGEALQGAPAARIAYRGSFVEPGSEVQLGDAFFLQVQAYSIAGFLALLGPTAIRVTDQEDVEAFLADAEAAVDQGVWSDVMTNPAVQLADVTALGGHAPLDGPRLRLYVGRDHEVRLSPLGRTLGTVGDVLREPGEAAAFGPDRLPCSRASVTAVRERPWLGRYHAALRALQAARARGHEEARVSGFGMRFDGDLPLGPGAPDLGDPLAPVLLGCGETFLVHIPATGADFQTDRDTVHALERALVTPEAAEEQALRFVERFTAPAERVGA